MFKISKLNDLSKFEVNVELVPLEIHKYDNGVKSVTVFNVPEFIITGSDDKNDYSFVFRFNKPMENLYDIELNTSLDICNYIDTNSFYLNVNGVFDLNVTAIGKIYRIINKTIVISCSFMSSEDDYSGKFEIEFNLDDKFVENEKRGIYEYKI